jgi:hypothetical protein
MSEIAPLATQLLGITEAHIAIFSDQLKHYLQNQTGSVRQHTLKFTPNVQIGSLRCAGQSGANTKLHH